MADGGGNGFQRGAVRLPEVGVLGDGGIPCVEPLGRGIQQVEAFRDNA